jgi:hypothetical protein
LGIGDWGLGPIPTLINKKELKIENIFINIIFD